RKYKLLNTFSHQQLEQSRLLSVFSRALVKAFRKSFSFCSRRMQNP
ncbi:unnamed protein product, partial [Staurois parvus]